MDGIIKMTYENNYVIGLGVQAEQQYYIFWGKVSPPSMNYDTITAYGGKQNCALCTFDTVSYIKLSFLEEDGSFFHIMLLKRVEDYEVAEKILKAVLINEQPTY